MDALQPLLGMPNNRLSVGWWSRGRVRNKKAIQFPHDDSHYTFYVSLRSDCPGQEKWPSTERRTFSATTQGIFEACSRDSPASRSPRGLDKTPQEQTSWRILKETFSVCRTPDLPLGPYGVKAVWPGPKPCHDSLFQQGEGTDSSQGSKKGGHPYDPSFLNPSDTLHLLPPLNPAVFHLEKSIQTKTLTSHTQNRMYRKVKHFWFPSQGIRTRAVTLTLHQKLILPPPPHSQASSPDSSSLHKAHA